MILLGLLAVGIPWALYSRATSVRAREVAVERARAELMGDVARLSAQRDEMEAGWKDALGMVKEMQSLYRQRDSIEAQRELSRRILSLRYCGVN